jgi:YVTN family beta-propeller protein
VPSQLLLRAAGVAALLASVVVAGCGGSTSDHPPTASGGAPDGGTSGATGTIYVTVYGADAVSAYDATSHALLRSISLGSGKGPAILLKTPDGKKLYVANWTDNTVSAVDVASGNVTNIALGSRPWVIAMSPAGDAVYAGLNANSIAVISTDSDTVTRMIDTNGLLPESIIVSPDGNTLYVAPVDQSSITGLLGGSVEAIAASDGSVIHAAIPVGMTPAWISVSPDGSKVYTLNFLSNSVSVVDSAAWKVTSTVPLGSGADPIIGAVTPSGTLVVTNFGSASVALIDGSSDQVTSTFKTSGRPVGVDISPDGSRGYVTDFGPSSLSESPNPLALQSGDLSSSIGTGPGEVVVFDPSTGAAIGDPIVVEGATPTSPAGPTSVVVLP